MKNGFLKTLYSKLYKINDTPQKISLGFGLGVFLGIFPGTGPLAALFLAMALRVNRASALIGSLLTNTWLSFVTFLAAVKLGSTLLGVNWQQTYQDWMLFIKDFRFANLCKLSLLKIILPVMLGYILIGLLLGLTAYIASLLVITKVKADGAEK